MDRDGARAAFDRAVEIAASTAEYMRLLETAPEFFAQALASPDSTFSYCDAQRIGDIQEQIERLSPGAIKRAEAMEPQQQQRQQQTQTMY